MRSETRETDSTTFAAMTAHCCQERKTRNCKGKRSAQKYNGTCSSKLQLLSSIKQTEAKQYVRFDHWISYSHQIKMWTFGKKMANGWTYLKGLASVLQPAATCRTFKPPFNNAAQVRFYYFVCLLRYIFDDVFNTVYICLYNAERGPWWGEREYVINKLSW